MKNILAFFKILLEIVNILKDSDGDGTPDILDKEPQNPEVH